MNLLDTGSCQLMICECSVCCNGVYLTTGIKFCELFWLWLQLRSPNTHNVNALERALCDRNILKWHWDEVWSSFATAKCEKKEPLWHEQPFNTFWAQCWSEVKVPRFHKVSVQRTIISKLNSSIRTGYEDSVLNLLFHFITGLSTVMLFKHVRLIQPHLGASALIGNTHRAAIQIYLLSPNTFLYAGISFTMAL